MHRPGRKKIARASHHLAQRHPLHGNAQQRRRQGRRHALMYTSRRRGRACPPGLSFVLPRSCRRLAVAGAGWSSPVSPLILHFSLIWLRVHRFLFSLWLLEQVGSEGRSSRTRLNQKGDPTCVNLFLFPLCLLERIPDFMHEYDGYRFHKDFKALIFFSPPVSDRIRDYCAPFTRGTGVVTY